jgi:putative FmdB family regulatory protein
MRPMPVYEYLCEKCESRFEALVRREKQKVTCKCGSKKVSRKYSVFRMNLGAAEGGRSGGKGICGCGQHGCAPCSAGL